MPADTGAVRIARPTVLLDGRESPTLGTGLIALRIEESVSGISACELAVGNWGPAGGAPGFLYFDRRDINFGVGLGISIRDTPLFTGLITGLEGQFPEGSPPQLVVLAEDRLQALRMTRRTRTFTDVTDEAVIRQIASDHGLTADVRLQGPTHRLLAQLNQSDLAFIQDRCRALEAEVWVEDRALKVRGRADRTGGELELGYGHELRELTVTADLADQVSEVTVGGWDVAAKRAISETATPDLVRGELAGGLDGGAVLSRALAPRTETVAHGAPITTDEARAYAEAILRRRARTFVRGRGLADTDPRLRVGRRVKLRGVGPLFDGSYAVTEARHVFDPVLGMRTEFAVERPGLAGS